MRCQLLTQSGHSARQGRGGPATEVSRHEAELRCRSRGRDFAAYLGVRHALVANCSTLASEYPHTDAAASQVLH
jgi:hypothetical protein